MRLVSPPAGGPHTALVLKTEEKGSDVNIATYMLADAFRQDCDQLILITNDSDLAEPVRIINKESLIPVGIFNQTSDTATRRSRVTGAPFQPARPSIRLKKSRNSTARSPRRDLGRIWLEVNFRRSSTMPKPAPLRSPRVGKTLRPRGGPQKANGVQSWIAGDLSRQVPIAGPGEVPRQGRRSASNDRVLSTEAGTDPVWPLSP